MKDKYSNKELQELEVIKDDLIISMFNTMNKRHAINIALKRAFDLGVLRPKR